MIAALLGAAVLIGHQTLPPMDRDESRFAQASKQMLNSGDLVTIRFQDELRAKKPAGIYWLQSASAALFGDEDIAPYRLPSLLAMLLSIYGTYRIARTLYKPQRAVLAAAACGGALLVFAEAHLAKTDSMLMLCCLLQQFALMRIYQGWQNGRRLPYWSYMGVWLPMAAGILIKGPVAPLLALTTIAALSAWHREIRWLRLIRPLRGFVIVAALTLPWGILVTLATDGAFLDLAIRGDFVAKVQSGQESHGAPLGTYLLLLPLLLWPASLLLPRAVSQASLLLTHVESRFLIAWIRSAAWLFSPRGSPGSSCQWSNTICGKARPCVLTRRASENPNDSLTGRYAFICTSGVPSIGDSSMTSPLREETSW